MLFLTQDMYMEPKKCNYVPVVSQAEGRAAPPSSHHVQKRNGKLCVTFVDISMKFILIFLFYPDMRYLKISRKDVPSPRDVIHMYYSSVKYSVSSHHSAS